MIKKASILFLLFVIGLSSQGQNFKKAFKALDSKSYTSARVIFTQAQKTSSTKAIGDYGMAVVLTNTSLRIDDMYKAYASIIGAKNNFANCDAKLKKKYNSSFNEEIINNEFDKIDAKLFNMVKKEDKVKSYDKHIEKCKESKFNSQAIDMRNAKAYAIALDFNTIPAYKDFADKYPNSDEYIQAKNKMYSLAWDQCVIYNERDKYAQFVANYPEASQVKEAETKIRKIDYKQALAVNTQDAFDAFIAKYPNSKEAKELQGKGVKVAYEKVEKFKRLDICESFLAQYPNSSFSARVVTIRDSLAYEATIVKNTPEDYTKFVENYPNAVQVPLAMEKMGKLLYSKEELQNIRAKLSVRNHKIESIKVYSKSNPSKILLEKKYDNYGNCIYSFEQIIDDYSELRKYYFSDAGDLLLKEQLLINNKIKSITEYSYDIKGLKTIANSKCSFNCLDSATVYVDSFAYDKNRNLLSIKRFDENNKLLESHIYSYDNKGNRIAEEFKLKIGNDYKTYSITMNYNGKGYVIQKSIKNEKGENTEVESFSYDGLNKVISSSKYDANGTLMRTYFYTAEGLVESETLLYQDDESKNQTRNWEYTIRK